MTLGAAWGDAPRKAVMRELIPLVLKDRTIFHPHSNDAGYRHLYYNGSPIADPARLASIWTAGYIAALHIVHTLTGPHPISPFLLYLSLETNHEHFVNKEFVGQFDTHMTAQFFSGLAEAEERKAKGEVPYLLPLDNYFIVLQGGEVRR